MLIAGVVLIILGVIFFLQNTGAIPYDTWNNLWPILLILIGLALMFSRRGLRSWRMMGEGMEGWRRREDRNMGGAESRAYGHEPEMEDRDRDRMHDKREDEM